MAQIPGGKEYGAGSIIGGFPAPGLRRTVRNVTGHDAEGKTVFLITDSGDHHKMMGDNQAVARIAYSTTETPVDLNNMADLKQAKENEVGFFLPSSYGIQLTYYPASAALQQRYYSSNDRLWPWSCISNASHCLTCLLHCVGG